MTTTKRQNPQRFTPTEGDLYENAGGGRYYCDKAYGSDAWMINAASGWSCFAVGIVRYEDGTIEWDYSKHGGFNPARLAEIRQRQRSMVNAMLCCMI